MSGSVSPRPAYRSLDLYRREEPPVDLDLSDNTNLFGTAPSALGAIRAWAGADPARYPSLATASLRDALGEWLGVRPAEVLPGCGSNDLLDSAMRAFAEPGSAVAFAAPTFVMTAHFAAANSQRPVPVPVGPDGQPDIEALVAVGAPITYLASPNNPAGTLTRPDLLDRLLDRARGIVILDEAYAEFAGVSRVSEAVGRERVVVTRTFSKAWGLAGLRVGYAVGAAPLIEALEKARGPFKVNALAERAAEAAVRGDRAWLAGVVGRVRASRDRFVAGLRARGFAPLESAANFVGVPVADGPAAAAELAASGIGVRTFQRLPHAGALLRVTIGPDPAMDRVLAALEPVAR